MIIKEHPNYMIFPDGSVYSIESRKFLRPFKAGSGYLYVSLNRKKHAVHKLVAKYFVPGYFPGAEVNHKDEDKANNSVGNLEWVTHKRNCNYGTRNLRSGEKHRKGVTAIRDGKIVCTYESVSAAAKAVGRHISSLAKAVDAPTLRCAGLSWVST